MPARHTEAQRAVDAAKSRLAEIGQRLDGIRVNSVDYKTLGQIATVDGLLREAQGVLPKAKDKAPQLHAVAATG